MKSESTLFLFFCLLLQAFGGNIDFTGYDLTYNDTGACNSFCERDLAIFNSWVVPITSINDTFGNATVQNLCYPGCQESPADVFSCARCDNYKAAVCPVASSQEDCDLAFAGCYEDCYCTNFCRNDYVFCARYVTELLAWEECKQMITTNCYIPCRGGFVPSDRPATYLEYCLETFTTKHLPGCGDGLTYPPSSE